MKQQAFLHYHADDYLSHSTEDSPAQC